MNKKFWTAFVLFLLCVSALPSRLYADDPPAKLSIKWDKVTSVSKTGVTLQVVVNPLLQRGSKIHKQAFDALREIKADNVRFVPWYPYPQLGVAALEPPKDGKTSWDFSQMDPLVQDFYNASQGRPVVLDFSTIPHWMFKTEYPVYYGKTPSEEVWSYPQGTELRDPTGKELGDYYSRVAQWYSKGGFTDEFGKRHTSGYHYKIDYWEVFNEPEFEHQMTPQQYTARYDAVVGAVKKVLPQTKFVGISMAYPAKQPEFFEYFLNPKNHKPGIPLDMISYHFYAQPSADEPVETHQYTMFEQADKFVDVVRYIESIRKRRSPRTGTMINEVGSILPDDINQGIAGKTYRTEKYWNLSGAVFAYLYAKLVPMGIDVLGESQLIGFPGQFPSVTMLDWETGKPNARYHVLKLLLQNIGKSANFVETELKNSYVQAQAFTSANGARKILLVNKRDRDFDIGIPGITGGRFEVVDQNANDHIAIDKIGRDVIRIKGFGVAVITLPEQK